MSSLAEGKAFTYSRPIPGTAILICFAYEKTRTRNARSSQLGIAQPVLSQQIKQMESMLGHALFERNPRGVTLTPVGEFFQRRAEVLRANIQDAIRTARRIGRGEDGSLVVGVCGSLRLSLWQILRVPGKTGTPGVTRISPSLIAPASL